MEGIKQDHESTNKTLINNSHEKLSRFINRLQIKMLLVTRESDRYSQQLDTNYEKEISGYLNNEPRNLLSSRTSIIYV